MIVSLTTKKRAYFFIVSRWFVGLKSAPTTDPDLGIVELCGYDVEKVVREWDRLFRVRIPKARARRVGP